MEQKNLSLSSARSCSVSSKGTASLTWFIRVCMTERLASIVSLLVWSRLAVTTFPWQITAQRSLATLSGAAQRSPSPKMLRMHLFTLSKRLDRSTFTAYSWFLAMAFSLGLQRISKNSRRLLVDGSGTMFSRDPKVSKRSRGTTSLQRYMFPRRHSTITSSEFMPGPVASLAWCASVHSSGYMGGSFSSPKCRRSEASLVKTIFWFNGFPRTN
mmetsp:Transcript_10605/g.30394  ORF Transcript_10605/g.30394 Transcript_10605/m.30394 type:complete len:213 (-) Transcript_10605:208-846(-)